MPRVNGIVSLQGSYEDMTFYHKDGKSFVRKKNGVSKERIENDPQFVRTRENMSEFSTSIGAAKLLRHSLGSLVVRAKDGKVSNRLMSAMSKIKNLDPNSKRGKRNVAEGLTTTDGRRHLVGFDFNGNAPLDTVMIADYTLENGTGIIDIPSLKIEEHLRIADGADHILLQCGVLNLDFATGLKEMVLSPVTELPIDMTDNHVRLVPPAMPGGSGVNIYVLMISFSQRINGLAYPLKSEEHNVLHIVDVSWQ